THVAVEPVDPHAAAHVADVDLGARRVLDAHRLDADGTARDAVAIGGSAAREIHSPKDYHGPTHFCGVHPHWLPPGSHSQTAASPQTSAPSPFLQIFVQNVAVGSPSVAQMVASL